MNELKLILQYILKQRMRRYLHNSMQIAGKMGLAVDYYINEVCRLIKLFVAGKNDLVEIGGDDQ